MYIFEESDILSRFFVETFQIFPVCLIKWINYYAGCLTNSEYFCVCQIFRRFITSIPTFNHLFF